MDETMDEFVIPENLDNQLLLQGYELKDVKAMDDGEECKGELEAIVSVFNNVDRYKERIIPGAFKDSLKSKLPKGVWMHDWSQPVAKTLIARETSEGLYIKGKFNLETQRGREAYSDVKNGLVDEFSIGFRVKKWTNDKETGIVDLLKLELFEWSPVLVGANPSTRVVSVKSHFQEISRVGLKFEEHSEVVLKTVTEYISRVRDYLSLKTSDGVAPNETRLSEFSQLRDALNELLDTAPSKPTSSGTADQLKSLRLAALKLDAELEGVLATL